MINGRKARKKHSRKGKEMSPRPFMTGRLPARYGPVAFALAAPGYIVDTPITSVVATRRATVYGAAASLAQITDR